MILKFSCKWGVYINYLVLSRENIEKYIQEEHSNKSILISITASDGKNLAMPKPNSVNSGIVEHIFCRFDDISRSTNGLFLMNHKDAYRIAHLVEMQKDNIDTIIVNCDAGVSRSAGVCAAIMKFLDGDDSKIFNNWLYRPNMYCYNLVLKELAEHY